MFALVGPAWMSWLAVAGAAAVAGVPALVARKVWPLRAWKVEPGAWFCGPITYISPLPMRWRMEPPRLVSVLLRKRMLEPGTSMVPPPLLMGALKLPQAENFPPRRRSSEVKMATGYDWSVPVGQTG